MFLSDLYKLHYEVLYLFVAPIHLISFPWSISIFYIVPAARNTLGMLPTAFLGATIMALGASINAVLIYFALFVRNWNWAWVQDINKRIKIAKALILVIITMKILAGLIAGYIFPRLGGGNAPLFGQTDAWTVSIGGLAGCTLAFFSVLTYRFLGQHNKLKDIYVYTWCTITMFLAIASLASMGIRFMSAPFIISGIIGTFVLFTKKAQRASSSV